MKKYYWNEMSNEDIAMITGFYQTIASSIRKLANTKASRSKIGKFTDEDEANYQIKLKELQAEYDNLNVYERCPQCGKEFHLGSTNLKKLFKDKNCLIFCSKSCSGIYYANKQHREETAEQKQLKADKISKTLKSLNQNLTHEQRMNKVKGFLKHWEGVTSEERSAINKKSVIKAKQTKLERYGNANYNNREQISKTYKLNNNINNPAKNWSHIKPENLTIIRDRELFKQFILSIPMDNRCIAIIAEKLGISRSHCSALINSYNLYQDYDFHIHRNISKPQIELENFVRSLYDGTIICNDRQIIKPLEIDIYIPDKQLAIEFNGNYYHSTINVDKKLHFHKSQLCEELGIRLIHIFEYEWEDTRQRPILENIIRSALGITETIYARKLDIEERKSASMREFFERNNIQGFRGGKTAICLIDKDTKEVYMSYIMGDAFFGKGKYQWEVIRGATKLGYTIVGGASKIWKYFIDKYNPENCVYYVDYNYFNGKSLDNLPQMQFIETQFGFKNYWVNERKVKNREPFRHKEIKKLEAQGLVFPIYNAGTKVYVWKNKKVY